MTEPHDPISDLVRRAHEDDPGHSEFDTDAGLADLRARTDAPAPQRRDTRRTIMAVDIVGYNNPSRTSAHLRVVHEGLWRILRGSFAATGIPWDSCFVENTGDGALILLPAEVAKTDLIAILPDRLLAELRQHNAAIADEARIQLRLALHADEDPVGSRATSLTFRMLDATEVKTAQKKSEASLTLLASESFYGEFADLEEFRRIDVTTKGESTTAWLRLLGTPEAGSNTPTGKKEEFAGLVDALLAIPAVRNAESRKILLNLPSFHRISKSVPTHAEDRLQIIALARTAQRFDHGLADLLAAVRTLDPKSPEVDRLAELVSAYSDRRDDNTD